MSQFILIVSLLLFQSLLVAVDAWHEWNYSAPYLDPQESNEELREQKKGQWYAFLRPLQGDRTTETWNPPAGYKNPILAPRPRRGHTMVLARKKRVDLGLDVYDSYLLLFGGRDNDGTFEHIPRTYKVEKINGTIQFTTYDDKPVRACDDPTFKYYTEEEFIAAGCLDERRRNEKNIKVGMMYNDVWAYRLCHMQGSGPRENSYYTDEQTRYFNGPCENTGWVLWNVGAPEGGCIIQLGIEVCNTPSERYGHAAAMFEDGTMYVYGGYSQRCQDFCDDIWFFDIYMKSWRQVYNAKQLQKLRREQWTFLQDPYVYSKLDVPVDNYTNSGPARRWRHTMTTSKSFLGNRGPRGESFPFNLDTRQQVFVLFGGHRLWHGFSSKNSEANDWSDFSERPVGGYLDDLWIYTKFLDDTTTPGQTFKRNDGFWKQKQPKTDCAPNPSDSWNSRFDTVCSVVWPDGRAGHGSAYDDDRNIVWIFGGYSTYFPYVSTDGPGSGPGISALGSGGYIPYPGFTYFKNDLWYYNLTSEYWYRIDYDHDMSVPKPRADMVLLLVGNILFMHGGYGDNNYFGDTWYFNITTNRWLEKTKFVYPLYPKSCVDDIEFIKSDYSRCTELAWPKSLKRNSSFPYNIMDYKYQDYYWPDDIYGPQWPIQQLGFATENFTLKFAKQASIGTPLFPYAKTGPQQYVRNRSMLIPGDPENIPRIIFEYCTTVFGEPTRGMLLDGLMGRANESIFIPQPKRKRPGWDGCRDRQMLRSDLENELTYEQPFARGSHAAVFFPDFQDSTGMEIFMYGGLGYMQEEPYVDSITFQTFARDDMWYYNFKHCINNCSDHGDCHYGFCLCHVGYYGEDCSNTSCPGTFCHYDPRTFEQICVHGCSAGYTHTDNDRYVQAISKLPCTDTNPGESHGICDGFGSTQCAPPFIGDDCSIKDCKSNCSFNGWCSVEFPVSRCMCIPGYFGEICEHKLCLNNCSYPNGVCNTTIGLCNCRMMYSPYNSSLEFHPWGGEDCSYLHAYSAAARWSGLQLLTVLVPCMLVMLLFVWEAMHIDATESPGDSNREEIRRWPPRLT